MTTGSTTAASPRGPRGGAATGLVRRLAERSFQQLSDWTYRQGWAARLSNRLGLQGRVRVRTHEFGLSRSPDSPSIRAVFASDFHAGPLTDPAILDQAIGAIAELRPDLLLLGGDFVARRTSDVIPLARRLATLSPPLGAFAVLGNHDLLGDEDQLQRLLEEAGVTLLVNRAVRLPAPHDDVTICGLDDPIYGRPDVEKAMAGATATRVVLMHAPDGLLSLADAPFELALCGHTHGGQIAMPNGAPIVVPRGRLSRRYSGGEYDIEGGRRLLVSRGVGCTSLPVRLFSPPEIHLCTLTPWHPPLGGYVSMTCS